MFDGVLELFDVLGPPFSEGCLSLAIPLFSFFRSGIDLRMGMSWYFSQLPDRQRSEAPHRLSSAFPFLNLNIFRQRALSLNLGLRRGIEGRDGIFPRVLCLGDGGGVLDIWHISGGVVQI